MHKSKQLPLLTPVDRYSILIAAFGHDLGHPGVNNAFMVNFKHTLASRYADISVLENYSIAILLGIIRTSGLLD